MSGGANHPAPDEDRRLVPLCNCNMSRTKFSQLNADRAGYTHSATNMIRLSLAWAPDADWHDKILIHLASANHGREEILQPNKIATIFCQHCNLK